MTNKICPECLTSYLTNSYDELCTFCLGKRYSHKETRNCQNCSNSFSVSIPLSADKYFCNDLSCKQQLEQNFQELKKEIENISELYDEQEEINHLREKIKQEKNIWNNINEDQYSKLMKLLNQKSQKIKGRDKKEEAEEKERKSQDNFLTTIEELKSNPDVAFDVLPEWEKLTAADKALTKVVQKIIKEGERVKENLKKAVKECERELAKKHFHQRVDSWLDSYQLNMKHKEISLKDKDFSVLDNLVAEICGEQKSEGSEQEQKGNVPNKKEQTSPPNSNDNHPFNVGLIIGVAILVLGTIFLFAIRRKRKKSF